MPVGIDKATAKPEGLQKPPGSGYVLRYARDDIAVKVSEVERACGLSCAVAEASQVGGCIQNPKDATYG